MRRVVFYILFFPAMVLGAKEGFLGVYSKDLTKAMKKAIGVERGVLITRVVGDSPAEEAGIKIGDVILAINGEEIEDKDEFVELIEERPGELVGLTILREGQELRLKVKLGEKERFKIEEELGGSWGGGGGPIVLWVQPNLDEINSEIEGVIGKEFDMDMWLKGGGGYFSIWKNIRIGGVGGGGNQVKSGSKRRTEFSLGYGGFLSEYVIPLGKLQFFLGGIIGGGSIELKILRSNKTSWRDIWDNFKSDSVAVGDYEAYLDCGFFHYQPYIGAQYPLTPWCYLNLKGGYFGTLLGEWREMGRSSTGVPEMNLSNYCVSVGIIFGYFTR